MEGFFTIFLFYFSTLQIFLSNVDPVQSQRYKNIPEHAGYKKSRIACYDNQKIVLRCREPYIIHVEIVIYGKNSRETTCREDCCEGPKDCAIRYMTNQSTQFDDVSKTCDEKRSCEVMYPDDMVLLEGCSGYLDYIIVHYGCQLPHEIMFPTTIGENPTTESSTTERITTITSKATTITTTTIATPTTIRLTSTITTAATLNFEINLKTTSALFAQELLTTEYLDQELSFVRNNRTFTDVTDISISLTTLADNAANSDNRKSTTSKYILGTSTNSTSKDILGSPTPESQFSSTSSLTQQKDDFNTHHELTTNRFMYDTTLSKFSPKIVTQQEDDESFEDDDDTSTVRNNQSNGSIIEEEDISAVLPLDFTSRTNLLILAGIGVALLLAIAITTACTAWAITRGRRERRVERRENRENYRRRAQMSTPYTKQSSKYKASDKRWDDDEYDSLHANARL